MPIISERSLELVKATAPAVIARSLDITSHFYKKMMNNNPEVLQFFNLSNQREGRQQRALADSIVKYAANIERLQNLGEDVERIAHKHCALNIRAEHYPIVHDNLMATIKEIFGAAVITDEIYNAWSEAVLALAKILINYEAKLYSEVENANGGWSAARKFVITEKKMIADDVVLLSVESEDRKPILVHKIGQIISVAENPTSDRYFAPRHYTIVSPPGANYYSFAVKLAHFPHHHHCNEQQQQQQQQQVKEQNPPIDGVMSSFLHSRKVGDVIHLYPPFGPSFFDASEASSNKTAVFVSNGVGITPTIAYLPQAVQSRSSIAVFHADKTNKSHPFKPEIDQLLKSSSGRHFISYSYSKPEDECKVAPYYSSGRLTFEKIVQELKSQTIEIENCDFYVCASASLTEDVVSHLRHSYPTTSVHYELFGPHITIN